MTQLLPQLRWHVIGMFQEPQGARVLVSSEVGEAMSSEGYCGDSREG